MTKPDPPEVIDEANWHILRDMIIAAHAGDIAAFRAAGFRLENDVPIDEKAGNYVAYLLWRLISNSIQGELDDQDLRSISEQVNARKPSVLRVENKAIENTIRTVFGKVKDGDAVGGSMFVVLGTAILAALLDDVPRDFDDLYPYLYSWYRRKYSRERLAD